MSIEKTFITQFQNVDVDLKTQFDLDALLNDITDSIIVLNKNELFASFELKNYYSDSVEETVIKILELINSFSPQAKAVWEQCESRILNIGIQAGSEPHEAYFTLSNKVLSLLTSVQCEITFTVYACLEI